MSATEKLRALLDERGVKLRKAFTRVYKDKPDTVNHYTHWGSLIGNCSYHEMETDDDTSTFFEVFGVGITPEQAIAATLGNGTCYVVNETWNDYDGMERDTYDFKLSCGHSFEWLELEPPKHCPDCGKEIRR